MTCMWRDLWKSSKINVCKGRGFSSNTTLRSDTLFKVSKRSSEKPLDILKSCLAFSPNQMTPKSMESRSNIFEKADFKDSPKSWVCPKILVISRSKRSSALPSYMALWESTTFSFSSVIWFSCCWTSLLALLRQHGSNFQSKALLSPTWRTYPSQFKGSKRPDVCSWLS